MEKIRYINLCVVGFARRFGMSPPVAFNYLKKHRALDFLDRHYEAEHLLPLADALHDMHRYCRKNGGTI